MNRYRLTGIFCTSLLALASTPVEVAAADPDPVVGSFEICISEVSAPDPYEILLEPTSRALGATGEARLRFAPSPFGVKLTPDGRHVYRIDLETSGLPSVGGELVAWAATPELDEVRKLGRLEDGRAEGEVDFNKFLVFVTHEESLTGDRWSGPILLRGISRSGRMHTMAGHGPFEGEPCF